MGDPCGQIDFEASSLTAVYRMNWRGFMVGRESAWEAVAQDPVMVGAAERWMGTGVSAGGGKSR